MPVLGVGGFFFRARDPEALAAWYCEQLGVGAGLVAPGAPDGDAWSWSVTAGPVVFSPFVDDTDYWPAERQVMLNLRVSQLDALLDALRAAGVPVITKPEWDDPQTGRFARVEDPEGNPIELWEPPS